MSPRVLLALAGLELRMRLRRLSTLVVLLAVVAISWAMITEPSGGMTLLTVDQTRVLYTSSTLAVGSTSLGGLLFSLAGFFLLRGRSGEDLRAGTGSVIATTPVGNAVLLGSRWLGGAAYLGALVLAFMGTMLVFHALRGEGPLQPWVYLQTFCLVLLPSVFFSASCAVLFDSFPPLMGKAGDVLFFLLWVGQLSLSSGLGDVPAGEVPGSLAFDFPGIATAMLALQHTLQSRHVSLGMASFDPALAPLTLGSQLWTASLVLTRAACATLALLPLLPAGLLFHRFSPDRVKASQSRRRRSPLALLDGWLRPLARGVRPLFRLGALLPGLAGQVVADVALTLAASPSAILALLLLGGAGLWLDSASLGPLLAVAVACWGLLVADVSVRDFQAGLCDMTGAVPGGASRRHLRQLAAAFALGLLFTGAIAARWVHGAPLRAGAVVAGVFALSALATLLGRLTNTARTFTALFLFGLYVVLNTPHVPMLDVVGFHGAATLASVLVTLAIGAAAGAAGFPAARGRAWR